MYRLTCHDTIFKAETLAEEHWLTDEEFMTFKTLLYKLLEGDWGNTYAVSADTCMILQSTTA